jgi:t-SNARE complex subunit (syntaxin)
MDTKENSQLKEIGLLRGLLESKEEELSQLQVDLLTHFQQYYIESLCKESFDEFTESSAELEKELEEDLKRVRTENKSVTNTQCAITAYF